MSSDADKKEAIEVVYQSQEGHSTTDSSAVIHAGCILGSFDPFHLGHLKMVSTLLQQGCRWVFLLLPASHFQNKKSQPPQNSSFEQRLETLKRVFIDDTDRYGSVQFIVGIAHQVLYITLIDELEAFVAKRGQAQAKISFAVGTDSLICFKDTESYYKKCNMEWTSTESAKLQKMLDENIVLVERDSNGSIETELDNNEFQALSSTFIRGEVNKYWQECGDDLEKLRKRIGRLVPSTIATFIIANRLYCYWINSYPVSLNVAWRWKRHGLKTEHWRFIRVIIKIVKSVIKRGDWIMSINANLANQLFPKNPLLMCWLETSEKQQKSYLRWWEGLPLHHRCHLSCKLVCGSSNQPFDSFGCNTQLSSKRNICFWQAFDK